MQEKAKRRTNAARTEATRATLIAAARELFCEKGYAETSTPEIVRAVGITRGALYHHFADKADLFRAVITAEFVAIEEEITRAATRAPSSALDALLSGGRGYLKAMRAPGRVRLMLLDGPAVLGRRELDRIDRETSADSLRKGLKAAMDTGELRRVPLEPLTILLSAMFERAALAVADGDDEADHLSVIDGILKGLG